jgi:hypothetical protein
MSDQQNDSSDNTSTTSRTLNDQDIKTTRLKGRRLFLASLGITVLGATAIAIGRTSSSSRTSDDDSEDSKTHHDFPKGNSDGDTTQNKDLKAVDSDDRNSKAVDTDQNRLRDAKRSTDSD